MPPDAELLIIGGYCLNRLADGFPMEAYGMQVANWTFSMDSGPDMIHRLRLNVELNGYKTQQEPPALTLTPAFAYALDKLPIEDIARYIRHRIDKGPTSA